MRVRRLRTLRGPTDRKLPVSVGRTWRATRRRRNCAVKPKSLAGQLGFQDATTDISRIEFSNGYIGARDFSITSACGAPEPATWAMMLLGFLGLGGIVRAQPRSDRQLDALRA